MAEKAAPKTPNQNKITFEEALEDENHTPVAQAFVHFFESCFTVPDLDEAKRFLDDVEVLVGALKGDEQRLLVRIDILTGKNEQFKNLSAQFMGAVKAAGKEEMLQEELQKAYVQLGSTRMAIKMLGAMILNTTKTLIKKTNNPLLQIVSDWMDICHCPDCNPNTTKDE